MKKLVLVFLFLNSSIGFAQFNSDILYFNDGDSIEGFAEIKKNKIKFSLSEEAPAEAWDYLSVEKVKICDFNHCNTFEYVQLKKGTKPILLELKEKIGGISYYQREKRILKPIDAESNSDFVNIGDLANVDIKIIEYLKKEGQLYPTCVDCGVLKNWKRFMLKYFSNCEFIQNKIKTNNLKEHQIIEILDFYSDPDFCP